MNPESDGNLTFLKQLEEQYFGEHKHEAREIERLPSILGEVKCFVDVGSSLGQYAYFAGEVLKDADIYCIEPDPLKAKRLRELVGKWALDSNNRYHVVEKALSDAPGRSRFYFPKDHLSSGAFFPLSESADDWEQIEVEVDTLDNIFKGKKIDFMKIDVEGAEYRVLKGAIELLKQGNTTLLMEIAPWGDLDQGRRPSDVLAILEDNGYTFSVFENHYLFRKGGIPVLFRLKSRIMGYILDNVGLKVFVKKVFEFVRCFYVGRK